MRLERHRFPSARFLPADRQRPPQDVLPDPVLKRPRRDDDNRVSPVVKTGEQHEKNLLIGPRPPRFRAALDEEAELLFGDHEPGQDRRVGKKAETNEGQAGAGQFAGELKKDHFLERP